VSKYRALFSDSILEMLPRRCTPAALGHGLFLPFQCIFLAIIVLVPLWFTEALPKPQLLTFLVAPPPPPPPPPPVTQAITKVIRQTDVLSTGQLRTPTRIPEKVEMIKEEETPPPVLGGVVGGVPGGIPGGQLGGVIGGIITSTSSSIAVVPKLEPVKRIRISQGVTRGLLLQKIEPKYPKIAIAARITGVVLMKAVISKDGNIKELQVVSGHPMLFPYRCGQAVALSALPAKWRACRSGNNCHSNLHDVF